MLRAVERGLSLADFENLTLGMILGFITIWNNERLTEDEPEVKKGDTVRMATQADFDRF